ncbi:MAG: BamA/TamA family outer membrane protein [Holophaga sp.]|nr:BamA/TamA family outer membrane protein [Holophaga sp.]
MPHLLLAASMVCMGAPDPAVPSSTLLELGFQGGSVDDAAYARVAAGLALGAPVSEAGFQTALAAIRLTDRFRQVDGQLRPGPDGVRAQVRLEPWPAIQRLTWAGDAHLSGIWKQLRGLRTGMRPGEERMAAWSRELQGRLVEVGYPEAKVTWTRIDNYKTLVVTVTAGPPSLVRQVVLGGDPSPYTEEEILGSTKLVPGRTLWSQAVQVATNRNLRRKFQSELRYEAQTEVTWDGKGTVRVTVVPGPRVFLESEGNGLGFSTSLKNMVPLTRADRYSPELMDEGDRRIVRFFRAKGYLDAQVTHRREVTRADPPAFQEVTITYTIAKGEKTRVAHVRFEGNQAFGQAELLRAAGLPGAVLGVGSPQATPDLLDGLEARVKAYYLSRGYTEASLRRQLERTGHTTDLVFRVREGPQRLLQWIKLELPPGGFGDPWGLGETLPLIFSEKPVRQFSGRTRIYGTDRRTMAGLQGVLTRSSGSADEPVVLTLTLNRPIPLLKGDLERVFSAIRQQRLPALGVVRPLVRLNLEPAADGTGVRIQVPAQPMEQVQRLVVAGSDKTRAEAVLRETQLKPGALLAADQLSRAQARLSYLGAFQRVDLRSLAAAPEDGPAPAEAGQTPAKEGPPVPWKEGDLKLSLEERPPYVITNSFGYDKTQGYHVGVGLQQLNVGGMGRTMDYNIRAGNGTIQNPTLARMFPTGTYNRSVDSFTVGYTDPWFTPALLPDRTQFRTEGAYIQEAQSLYDLHRRRFTNSLQWSLTPQVTFVLGYRWERVDVGSTLKGITADELSVVAQYPTQTTVSAPFAQVARDTRDNAFDPTSGMYSVARVEFANQLFLTSSNSSFVKVDLRNQWTWPVGYKAQAGVVALGLRVGIAKPTASSAQNLPLSERFFAGGPFSFRGVEPDALGVQAHVPLRNPDGTQQFNANGQPIYYATPVGGQGLALINLEYRFPILRPTFWGEIFVDSGQVYESLTRLSAAERAKQAGGETPSTSFPPFRTALGLGLIFKIGIPLKIEYAADLNRILGRPRSQNDIDTQLKSLLISAGFQF